MLHLLKCYQKDAQEHLDNYYYHKLNASVIHLITNGVSALYYNAIKDRLYCDPANSLSRKSAQYVLNAILQIITRSVAAIVPHLAEELYAHFPLKELDSFFKTKQFNAPEAWYSDDVSELMLYILNVRKEINKQVGGTGKNKHVTMFMNKKQLHKLQKYIDEQNFSMELSDIFQVASVEIIDDAINAEEYKVETTTSNLFNCPRCRKFSSNNFNELCYRCHQVCAFSSSIENKKTVEECANVAHPQKKEISKAMKAYLERAREHDEFMKQQKYEFQIGKRHLANMMGEDPETFTQEDIDNAIEYLFPSGLYEKRARPRMRPPEEVFPQRKAAEFDETGRPHHFLFYTGNPNFYKLLHDIVEEINNLNKFEDAMIKKNNTPDPNLALQTAGYQWIDKELLEKKLVEGISDKNYNSFINAMDRLKGLPYSYRASEFISLYQKPLMKHTNLQDIPKLQYDKDGKAFIIVYGIAL
ncbi:hypothetical protein AMK59_2462 [Oryctes borbonicus]|uniref:Methionyl/Valyl/Leucyl/Isoleucyl-tRNA synthetase anticodon-binding domain-containing protein n=1 Tax=Oryctes borbonicus TaxID=1629725 RepID=A0A0T6BDJ2_9SCAR|nr:hypothetical protein AMK59_2462 [Oryctes borbonicus]